MRNYIIINGINSLTIPGLAINILPPISKPMMRYMREEIDGRDGDINTELGYQAYDRPLEVGLFGDYDINQVIAFFNSKGKITFSDEPDKFYNFQILEKIDFTKLVKFRTATVNIHCQPFKYPVTETPLEEEYEYVEATGTNVTLDNTSEAIFNKIDLIGNTEQTQYTGANILPQDKYITTRTINGITYTNNGDGTFNLAGTATANTTIVIVPTGEIELEANQPYYLYSSVPYNITTFNMSVVMTDNGATKFILANGTYTPTTTPTNEKLQFYIANGQSVNQSNIKIMLVKGSTAPTNYEPYVGGTASPNPNFPEPVNVVSGDNEINICGKNLFDESKAQIGKAWNNATNNARAVVYVKVQPNTTYTLSAQDVSNVDVVNYFEKVNDTDSTTIGGLIELTTTRTITTSSTTNYIGVQVNKTAISLSDIEGIDLQIEKGSTATTYEPYIGNTYSIYLGVENLLKYPYQDTTKALNGVTFTDNGDGTITVNGTATANSTFALANANIQWINEIRQKLLKKDCYLKGCPSGGGTSTYALQLYGNSSTGTGTLRDIGDGIYLSTFENENNNFNISIFIGNGTTVNNLVFRPQLSVGNNHTSTTPIELCKIGTYQDYIYKDNGSWYLHKEIGKVVLDGSEDWSKSSNTSVDRFIRSSTIPKATQGISNYFSVVTSLGTIVGTFYFNENQQVVNYSSYGTTTLATFKTWLGTNKPIVYYVLATSTNTLIEDTTLIEQLEEIKNAISYKGQTNISQTNNDMPFILDLSALELGSDHLVINSQGNIYSKPTLDLEGSGIVDIYLNDNQILEADLTEAGEIVIDTEAMEATNPSTGLLANRQVTGDYSRIKLDPGENDLRFSGDLTKAIITNYERWL